MPHVSVYVDESGDLGFSSSSSNFFTVGYVFTVNRYPTMENKTIKRSLKNFNTRIKNKNKKLIEFKFSANNTTIRKKFLSKIKNMDIVIGIICISKDSVKNNLKKDPSMLYRYLIGNTIITHIIKDYFRNYDHYNSIRFVIDRSLSLQGRKEFNKYCEDKALFRAREQDGMIDYSISINHEDSRSVPMLQVADYIASSTQRKIERADSDFYEIIKDKIQYFEKWDWNGKINW